MKPAASTWLRSRSRAWVMSFIVVGFIAFAFSVSARGWLGDGSDSELGDRIVSELLKRGGQPYPIADAAPFPWNELFVFPPYTTAEIMEKTLGFPWNDATRVDLGSAEGAVVLAFVLNRQVVRYVRLKRHPVDFAPFPPIPNWRLSRRSAIFKTRTVDSGSHVYAVAVTTATDATAR